MRFLPHLQRTWYCALYCGHENMADWPCLNFGGSLETLISSEEMRKWQAKIGSKTLQYDRKVKFIYQYRLEDGAFITAWREGNRGIYLVRLAKAGNPLRREVVESHFEVEGSKK